MSSVSNSLYDAPKPSAPLLEEGADVQQLIAKAEDIAKRIEQIQSRLTKIEDSWNYYQSGKFSEQTKKEKSALTYEALEKLEKTKRVFEQEILDLEKQFLNFDNTYQMADTVKGHLFKDRMNLIEGKLGVYKKLTGLQRSVYKTLPWGYSCVIS